MSAVFADTFYWVALTNPQDSAHERAKHFSRSVRPAAIVTTEYVLTEYLNYFAAWGHHCRLKAGGDIAAQPGFFVAGLELYRNRLDKGYSLTDCVSMSVMLQEGISDALTNDAHFVQEGFRASVSGMSFESYATDRRRLGWGIGRPSCLAVSIHSWMMISRLARASW